MTTDKGEYKYDYEPVAGREDPTALPEAQFDAENGKVTIQTPSTLSAMEERSPAAAEAQHPNNRSKSNNSISSGPADRKFLYIAACVGNLAAFTCGTTFGWTSPEIPQLQTTPENGNPLPIPITTSQESWIGSLLPVGASLGPFAAGIAADKIGRKNTILVGTAPFVLAFLMAAYATSPTLFFISRFICGLSVGFVFTALPMYIGEISTDEVRGSLGSFMQLFITVGLLFSYVVGPYVSIRLFNLSCVVIPVAFLVGFYLFIPESPYYLIQKDKQAAEDALVKLRAKPKEQVQEEMEELKLSYEEAVANKASFMDIFKSKGLTKALIISVGLVALQQLSGINIVLFYAQSIFADTGSTIPPEISTIIIGVVQVLASALTPMLVERKGKRFLLLLSAIGMAVSQGTLAYFFYLKAGGSDVQSISWLPVTSLVVYIITYCLGFGPLPWAVMGELFPGNIKSAASTVTAAGCWFLGFIITKYFSLLKDLVGISGSFALFSLFCVGAAVFVYMYLPETSGKSLQEIQDILSGKTDEGDAEDKATKC